MGTKIKLTENQLNRMMKRLVSEDTPGVGKFEKGQFQKYTLGGNNFTGSGSDLFKQGQDQINPNNNEFKSLINQIKTASNDVGINGKVTVTIDGGASNTSWGGNPAGSVEAMKKNKELAQRRINNTISFLQGKLLGPNIFYVPGNVTIGKKDSKNPEMDQYITASIDGKAKKVEGKINVDRDNTSIQYNVRDAKFPERPSLDSPNLSRVCSKIPSKYVSELKKVIYNWGKTKGLQIPISDKTV